MLTVYMVDDVWILKWMGDDEWGEEKPRDDIAMKCKINFRTKWIRDYKGEETVSMADLDFLYQDVIDKAGRMFDHKDRIQIAGESIDNQILKVVHPKRFTMRTRVTVFIS